MVGNIDYKINKENSFNKSQNQSKSHQNKKSNYWCFAILIIFINLITPILVSASIKDNNLVNIYFFHSNSCSHCKSESKLLDYYEKEYDNIKIYRYEIHESENVEILKQVQKIYNLKIEGVPITIIGDNVTNGYSEEQSKLQFNKMIAYYSRYGYHDKIGESLKIGPLPQYEIKKNDPTLEKFMKDYGDYNIIGSIYTDNLEPSLSALLLGFFSKLNPIFIITSLIVLWIINRIISLKKRIILLITYIMTSFLLFTTFVFSNELYTLILEIFLLILFMLFLLKYSKILKSQILIGNLFIIIAILSNYIESFFLNDKLLILKNIASLHNLIGLDKLIYYSNYLFGNIIAIATILFLLQIIIKKVSMKDTKLK